MAQTQKNDLIIDTKLLDNPDDLVDDFVTTADALLQRQREVRQAIAELRLSGYSFSNRHRENGAYNCNNKEKDILNSSDMSGRSQNRNSYSKRCIEEYVAQKKAKEEEEFIREFKARPAPAKFRIPVLHKLTEKQKDHQRRLVERERLTRDALQKHLKDEQNTLKSKPQFKARPLPKYLESKPKLSPEIKAEKAYRNNFDFVPKRRREVPDFKALQEGFRMRLEMARLKYYEDIGKTPLDGTLKRWEQVSKDETISKQERMVVKSSLLRKPRVTRSFKLMKQATEKKIAEFNRRDREAQGKLAHNHADRESFVQAKICHSLRNHSHMSADNHSYHSKASIEAKVVQNRQYKNYLHDVYQSLDDRPCMFERMTIERAVKKAEQEYKGIISLHGLDKSSNMRIRR